jgi:hypothetical protein
VAIRAGSWRRPATPPSVVSLGTLKIHTADEPGALEVAEIAKIMLQARAPLVRHHAMWYLALLALPQGDPMRAHGWLSFSGHEERLSMLPLYPHEVAYDAERVRIAAAVGDEELADHAISIAERRASLNPDVHLGRLSAQRGDDGAAIAALDEALTIAARRSSAATASRRAPPASGRSAPPSAAPRPPSACSPPTPQSDGTSRPSPPR